MLPPNTKVEKLTSWTEFNGEEFKSFSGTAKYTTQFARPSGYYNAWAIDLGKVHETAEVFLNGKKLATLLGPSFRIVVPFEDLKTVNTLEVVVSNLMANRIIYMDKNQLPWKIFYNTNMPARKRENVKNGLFDASSWEPLPSGILGPVTITPINYE